MKQKKKMPNVTVEGADLVLEIGKKIKKEFSTKEIPLMISIIDTICDGKPLIIKWNYFK